MNVNELFEILEREEPKPIKGWFMKRGFLGYNSWYWVTHPHLIIPEAIRSFRRFIIKLYQRGTRGWADEDTWSLDYYILSWLPDALEKVAEDSHGAPPNFGFSKKEIEEFYAKNSTGDVIDGDLSHAIWQDEVRDIAKTLRTIHEKDYTTFLSEEDIKLFKKTWKRLGKIFFTLWT